MNQEQTILTPYPNPIQNHIPNHLSDKSKLEKLEKIEKKENFDNKVRSSEMFSPSYRPMTKNILIEAFYSLIFSHHIPILMKHGTFLDDTPIISFDSVTSFFTSYIGKIVFFLLIYFTLHYFFLPFVRKIEFS